MNFLATSPSDLLARMAGLMVEAAASSAGAAHIEAVLRQTGGGSFAPPAEEWQLEAEAMCTSVLGIIGRSVAALPTSGFRLQEWIQQMERLDRWHEPLLPYNVGMTRRAGHRLAEDRLFSKTPRLNEDPTLGTLIPGRAWGRPFGIDGVERMTERGAPGGLMLRLLDVTAYLPPMLDVADADEDGPNVPTHRVPVRYAIHSPSRSRRSRRAIGDDIRVAVAPMAESATDLRLRIEGDRYSISPIYPAGRIDAIVRQAIQQQAQILLMPEMSVSGEALDRLKISILTERRAYAERENRVPALRYVCAGVAAPPERKGARHANFVIVLDENGDEIVRQHKLRHWNLGEDALARFDILPRSGCAGVRALFKEDTDPGGEVVVVDLDGLGRLFALICADMDQRQPGHWLLENLPIDWLYAPIMDGSTCWTQRQAPWIIDRAARAAELGASRVMVTNSMTMTQWNNEVIQRARAKNPDYRYREYKACGIGLFLDGNGPTLLQHHVTVRFEGMVSPVLRSTKWLEDWAAFDSASS